MIGDSAVDTALVVSNADFGQPTDMLQLMLPTDSRSGVVALYYRHPGLFGWALGRTTDFVNFTDLGGVIPGGGDDAQDQFVFAGSVFCHERSALRDVYRI